MIDLRQLDLTKQGPVKLNGTWEFYWKKLIHPSQFPAKVTPEYIHVVGTWNKFPVKGNKIPGIGYATYRLKVVLQNHEKDLGLKILDASSCLRIFVNDKMVYQAGFPAETKERTKPKYQPSVVPINPESDILNITAHISNFHHWMGGAWQPVILGKASDLHAAREKNMAISLLMFGAICIIGFYHICLFWIRKKERAPLYFGLFCLLVGLRAIFHGERYFLLVFPSIEFWLFIKLLYLSIYLALPFITLYLGSLFPDETPKIFVRSVVVVCLIFSTVVVLMPSRLFSNTLPAFQAFTFCVSLFGTFVVIRAILNKRQSAIAFFIGLSIFVTTIINDILTTRMIIYTPQLIPLGLFLFLFTQAFLISKRFSAAFTTVEQQGEALKVENEQRRIVENHLKKSEVKYRKMIEQLPIPVGEFDFDYNVLFTNQAANEWFGYKKKEIESGINIKDFLPGNSLEMLDSSVRQMLQGNPSEPVELKLKKKEGIELWAQVTPSIIFVEDQPVGIRTCFVDLSERKKAETALLYFAEKEKLALVGQIAGKMAHDFNNVLSAIMGNTELALLTCDDSDMKKTFDIILRQTQRATTLTRNLVAFSKDQELKEEFFNINEKVDLVLNLLKKDLLNISISKELDNNNPQLMADPGMVEHALVNIIQNAIHATSKTDLPEIKIRTYSNPEDIFIEISDNGCGIPEEFQNDIYTPAFTLKGREDQTKSYQPEIIGTGYGMANVKNYVDKHHGRIWFTSQKNIGTTFTISFPVIEKELTPQEKEYFTKHPVIGDKQILIVEDEPAISSVQCKILSSKPFHHSVRAVADGKKAFDIFKTETFDLVCLDHMLPGKDMGFDVYMKIRELNKTIPVIFVSGNIQFLKSMEQLKADDPFVDHLSKPYKNLVFANTINKLLLKTNSIKNTHRQIM